jgi:integrase
LTQWRAEIRKARGQDYNPKVSEAQQWRKSLLAAKDDEALEVAEGLLQDHAEALAKTVGIDAASQFYTEAMGLTTPLQPLYAEWVKQLALAPKTMDQMGRDVAKLVEHFTTLQRLTPKGVKAWTDVLVAEGATHASLKRILGSGRSFWKYLQSTSIIEHDAIDPFAGMIRLTANKVQRNRTERKEFTAAEVSSLYAAAVGKGDSTLADLIALGAHTGARIEELCSLTVGTSEAGVFTIIDAKTAAGNRQVPVHTALEPLLTRLRAASTDGFLIPSGAAGKYGVRSDPLSKRFGRLKASMKFGPDLVFHSIRKTVATMLEQAAVPEGVAADILGHEKATMSYGLYSGGSSMAQKLDAITKVVYPAPLDRP